MEGCEASMSANELKHELDAQDRGSEPSTSSSAGPGRPTGKAAAAPVSSGGGNRTPRGIAGADANPLLIAIRRELKSSEERLTERVARVERRAEQFREAECTSLDEKFAELRSKQTEYDRKLAEMGGSVKGIQDELQGLVRRVSGMDSAQSQRRTEEASAWRSKVVDLEQQLQAVATSTQEKLDGMQAAFEELAASTSRLDVAEMQIEHLTEAFERTSKPGERSTEGPSNTPPAAGSAANPSMGQILQCERTAREAEEAADRACREAERLSLQVRQALSQTEEQKARMLLLIERVTQNEQTVRGASSRATLAGDLVETSQRPRPTDPAVGRDSPPGYREEVDEIKYELERHWKGMHEVKEAVELVNDKFTRDLKAVKEAQKSLQQLDTQESARGNNGRGTLTSEVQALRDCIIRGEAAIQNLAPKLLQAVCTGKDLKLVDSARGLQEVTSYPRGPAEPYYDEDSQPQSRVTSRDYSPSPSFDQGGNADQGEKAQSCFSGCFKVFRK